MDFMKPIIWGLSAFEIGFLMFLIACAVPIIIAMYFSIKFKIPFGGMASPTPLPPSIVRKIAEEERKAKSNDNSKS